MNTEKQIQECKNIAMADLNEMGAHISEILRNVSTIDECDDEDYLDRVVGYTDRIREILLDLSDLERKEI